MISYDDFGRLWMTCPRCYTRGLALREGPDTYLVHFEDDPRHRERLSMRDMLKDGLGCGYDTPSLDGGYRCGYRDGHDTLPVSEVMRHRKEIKAEHFTPRDWRDR